MVCDDIKFRDISALLGVGAASILIGIFGILGTFCRSKAILVFYAVLLCVVFILQIIFGGLTIATSSDTEKVAAYSNVVWEGMNNDLRNAFQKQNKCCGFSLATDRPGDNCSIPWLINPCESYVEASVTSVIRQTGIYAFVSAAVELGAIIIAFILAFDDEKRVQGYGRGV